MRYLVVTSWSEEGEKKYGGRWRETFSRNWPASTLALVVDDIMLRQTPGFTEFMTRHKDKVMDPLSPSYDYRRDMVRFAHKIFALKRGLKEAKDRDCDWLVWLDGDVETVEKITDAELEKWMPSIRDGSFLSRGFNPHPECGFMAFNLRRKGEEFVAGLCQFYETDSVLKMPETHDSFVIGTLLRAHIEHQNSTWEDLCPKADGLEAFGASPLKGHLVHHKGPQKLLPPPHPEWPSRYHQLFDLVAFYKPRRIIEVGTWGGHRAIEMVQAAHAAHGGDVEYFGYDLFEEKPDRDELHVKRSVPRAEVEETFRAFASGHPWFSWHLISGDTRQTLVDGIEADFAYIDGGYSVETIRSDYARLKHVKVVALNSFFTADENSSHPDITRFGCNEVTPHGIILPSRDRVVGGGIVHLCVIVEPSLPRPEWLKQWPIHAKKRMLTKEERSKLTGGAYDGNMVVLTRNCVPDEVIQSNVRENLSQITRWMHPVRNHDRKALIISAGESVLLPGVLEEIKSEQAAGAYVFCVKHIHNWLIEHGVVPWGCILLDPRPHVGRSTHGHDRAEMLANPDKRVRYFPASMVDPGVIRRIQASGATIFGWHAMVGAGEDKIVPKGAPMVMGGTSSAGRGLNLLYSMMGFNDFVLYGFDSCHLDDSKLEKSLRHPDGSPKYVQMEVTVNGQKGLFWTDRDLLAQHQDFARLMNDAKYIRWEARGPGMVAFMWRHSYLPPLIEQYRQARTFEAVYEGLSG